MSANPWTADRIRTLRGARTRAAFAALLSVSPLTVYRWELPDGAPEARRPRGAIASRLAQMEMNPAVLEYSSHPEAKPPSSRQPPSDLAPEERAALLPALERLSLGALRQAEDELLGHLAGTLVTPAGRALAAQGVARIQLWARGDVRGALATLHPVLADADAGRFTPWVAAEVQVTAALVYSGLDGRVLDAGRVNAYIARAGTYGDPFLCNMARLMATCVGDDPALARLVLDAAPDLEPGPSPLLRCFSWEMQAVTATFDGRRDPAPLITSILEAALAANLAYVQVRALAQVAVAQVNAPGDPSLALATVARMRAVERQGRVVPGWHSLMAAYAEGEALTRLGRLDEAERALTEGIVIADEIRWAYGGLPLLLARLLVLRGRTGELPALAARVASPRTAVYGPAMEGVAAMVAAVAEALAGTSPTATASSAVDHCDEVARSVDAGNTWVLLRRTVLLSNAALALLAGTTEQAERAVRRAWRALEPTPTVWTTAALRWMSGVLAMDSRAEEARSAVEAAVAGFDAMGDRVHAALAGLTAGTSGALDTSELTSRLQSWGVAPDVARRPTRALPTPPQALDLPTRALAALPRLAASGMGPTSIQSALLSLLAELLPGTAVHLEELDSRGHPTLLGERGASDQSCVLVTGLGDSAGRRLRLTLSGADLDAARPVVAATAAVAAMALEVAALRGLAARPASAGDDTPELPGFVSASAAMRHLKRDIARLSRSRATVMISGESGAGKEVVARAVHDLSSRAGRPYVAFNCAAIPRDLFEGQLFGYRRGAFTGATADHPGVLRAADGGTVFLDEIAELPLDLQPKLLRFLENGEVLPLGERRPLTLDVRVIAATWRDLEQLVREGRFREDLFFRLQVVPLRVPPLRERPEDVAALARHFVRTLTPAHAEAPVLAPDAVAALQSHPWPGNVRELRNVIERSLAFDPVPPVLGAAHLRLG